jgi:CRP/FNR family transcriptional regulator
MVHESCAAHVPIFRGLPAEALAELRAAMRHRRSHRGECVASVGEPVQSVIVLAAGRLKLVHTTPAGREQVVRILEPGDFVGELALFTPARHEGDLIALEPAEVCLIPRDAVHALMQSHPAVALHLVRALAERLARAERLIADLSLRDVGQRLAAELVRLADAGISGPAGMPLRMPASWAELAARLGTTPESLSRRLAALADQGIIRQEAVRSVVILDLDRLRRAAEG